MLCSFLDFLKGFQAYFSALLSGFSKDLGFSDFPFVFDRWNVSNLLTTLELCIEVGERTLVRSEKSEYKMEDDLLAARRLSTRIRKVAPKMGAALADANNRSQVTIARLDALESDNVAMELVDGDDDEEASLDDEEHDNLVHQRRHVKNSKRETRQARAIERLATAKKTQSFHDLLQEANLESLPSHVPSYLRAAVGPPSSSVRRYFCSVCGYFAHYTCVVCGARFCCIKCQKVHLDTRCQKFVA